MTPKVVFAVDFRGNDVRVPRDQITATDADFAMDPNNAYSQAAPVFGVFERPTYQAEDMWIDNIERVAKEKGVDMAKISDFGQGSAFSADIHARISSAVANLRETCKANISLLNVAAINHGATLQLTMRDDSVHRDFEAYLQRNLLIGGKSNIDDRAGLVGKALLYDTKCMLRVAFIIYQAWINCIKFGLGCDDKRQALAKYYELSD